jgi:Tol biopolymer transport system component
MGAGSGAALTWFSRNGTPGETVGQGPFNNIRLSPDNSKLATSILDEETGTLQMWIYDLPRRTTSRFTFDPVDHDDPVWSPDGQTLSFDSSLGNSHQILRKRTDGSQPEESLWQDTAIVFPSSWSSDGQYLAYDKVEKGQQDIWILPISGVRKPFPYVNSDALEHLADFSPDGKWIVYASNASGREQVYVSTFPEPHARFQVSTAGGSYPRWREDGKELFYFDADSNVAGASILTHRDTVELGPPHVLFRIAGVSSGFALVAKDKGQHFLVAHYPGLLSSSLTLVTNWDLEMKR